MGRAKNQRIIFPQTITSLLLIQEIIVLWHKAQDQWWVLCLSYTESSWFAAAKIKSFSWQPNNHRRELMKIMHTYRKYLKSVQIVRLKVWINIFCPRHMWELQLILFTRYSVCNSNLFAEMQRHAIAGCQGAKTQATVCTCICTHTYTPTPHIHTPKHTHTPCVCDHFIDLQYAVQALFVIQLILEAKSRAAGNSKNLKYNALPIKTSTPSGLFSVLLFYNSESQWM